MGPSIRRAALPRFAMEGEVVDPSEALATSPRPALSSRAAARAVRRRADSTQEIGVEDILLEVYAEPEVAPASMRRTRSAEPSRAEQREVDELLAQAAAPSAPMFPSAPPRVAQTPPLAYVAPAPIPLTAPPYRDASYEAAEVEVAAPPSIAPVTASIEVMSVGDARALVASAHAEAEAPMSPARVALVALALLLAGVLIGVAIAFAFPEGPLGRVLHRGAAELVAARHAPSSMAASPRAAAAPPPAVAPVAVSPVVARPVARPAPVVAKPAPVAAPAPVVAKPVVAKPAPTGGVIVLPPKAVGHRVWIDKTVVDGSAGSVEVPCGARKIKIGSSGHRRTVDVPCGGTLTL